MEEMLDFIFNILGKVADFLGVVSFILLLHQGSQIKQLKQETTLKNKKKQFEDNKQQLVSEAQMFTSLLEEGKYDDKINFYAKINKFLSNLEYFQDVESIKDIGKNIKNVRKGI